MTKIQIFKTMSFLEIVNLILFLTLANLTFEFVSDFDIRNSSFANRISYIMFMGRYQNCALWTLPFKSEFKVSAGCLTLLNRIMAAMM